MTRRKAAPACQGCQFDPMAAGRIEGRLEAVLKNQEEDRKTLKAMDARLRHVENRSAIAGAVGGALMAIGVNFAGWMLRGKS